MASLANKDVDKSSLTNAVVGTNDKIITADILVQAAIIKFKAADPLPSSDIGAIWHDDYASVMTFRTIGSYTGYASVELGKVIMIDSTAAPAGYIAYDGATLSGSKYAALIAARGNATLVDGRGEFFRAADVGRGVDVGRAVGSHQPDKIKSHNVSVLGGKSIRSGTTWHSLGTQGTSADTVGLVGYVGADGMDQYISSLYLGRSPAVYIGENETAPRNIALLACIKY